MSQTPPMWARLPDETPKAFAAFQEYIKMPPQDYEDTTKRRSLLNLSEKLGYYHVDGQPAQQISKWSSKYKWVERSRAYDDYQNRLAIKVQDASLAQAQQDYIAKASAQVALMQKILMRKLAVLHEEAEAGHVPDALELNRTVSAFRGVDDLARRLIKLPTNFKADVADDELTDEMTFLIGGTDG